MIAVSFHWSLGDFQYWARTSGLEILLIGIGAALVGRLTHRLTFLYSDRIDLKVRAQTESGGVASERDKRVRAVAQASEWVIVALVYFIAGLLIFQRFKLPLTSLVAPATVAGVGIGFGAQQMVGDLLAGFFLFSERQFGVGDVIRLSLPGTVTGITGTVEELTLRVTKLRSIQGELVFLPNGALRQVTNLSREWSRVVVDVPIGLGEDVDVASRVLRAVLDDMTGEDEWRDVLLGPPIVAGVETIAIDHLELRLLARVLPGRQFEVGREIRLRATRALQEEGILSPIVPVAPEA